LVYTFTTADAGVHTFTATLRTAGTQSISGGDSSGALFGSQMGISVSPAAFAATNSPPHPTDSHGHYLMTAGDLISVTVKTTDIYGNARRRLQRRSALQQHRRTGQPARRLHVHRGGRWRAHLHRRSSRRRTANGVVWSINAADTANAALATITNFEVANAAASTFAVTVPTQNHRRRRVLVQATVTDAFGTASRTTSGRSTSSHHGRQRRAPRGLTPSTVPTRAFIASRSTLNTSGNQTLSVVDMNNLLINASANASVNAAAASALAASFPATTTAGVANPSPCRSRTPTAT